MDTLRKICIAICVPLLSLSLFLVLATTAFNAYFGTPEPLKKTLVASRVYDHIVTSILDTAKNKAEDQSGGEISVDVPQIKTAAEQSFSPEFIQKSSETIIDGVFGWLDGKTTEPKFDIDVSSARTSFIENVANAAVTHVESLPVCTPNDQITSSDKPFDATCRPPNFDANATKQQIVDKFSSEDSPLAEDSITFADLQGKNEKPITEKLAVAPKAYQLSKKLPYALGLIAFLLSGAIFLLHSTKVKAFRTLGKVFISTGVAVLVLATISWFIAKQANFSGGKIDQTLQQDLIRGFKTVSESFSRTIFIGGAVYTVIGVLSLVLAKKLTPPLSEEQKQNNVNTVLNTKELSVKDAVEIDTKAKDDADKAIDGEDNDKKSDTEK